MNSSFIVILQKLLSEQGKDIFLNSTKYKALLADYTQGDYKKESRLLLQAVEAGVSKAVDAADDLTICKKQQIRLLREDHFLDEDIAGDLIDTLILILKGKNKLESLNFINQKQELQTQPLIKPEMLPTSNDRHPSNQYISPVMQAEKQRHGFTTFCLVLGLIFGSLQILGGIIIFFIGIL